MTTTPMPSIWIVQDLDDGAVLGVFLSQAEASELAEARGAIYASYKVGFGSVAGSGENTYTPRP